MKQIYQTDFTESGNCFEACLASILEVSIEDIPNFKKNISENDSPKTKAQKYEQNIGDWTLTQDFFLLKFSDTLRAIGDSHVHLGIYCIVVGQKKNTHNAKYKHAAVMLNGEIVFDPNPDAKHLEDIENVEVSYLAMVIPKNPAKKIKVVGGES